MVCERGCRMSQRPGSSARSEEVPECCGVRGSSALLRSLLFVWRSAKFAGPARRASGGDLILNPTGLAVDANGTDPTTGAGLPPTVGSVGPNVLPCPSCGGGGVTDFSAVFSNDCQNFVDQALKAGGWPNDFAGTTLDPTNYKEWYFRLDPFNGQPQWSTTWDNTVWWMRYVYNNPDPPTHGFYQTSWSAAVPGDIIQVDWDGTANGLKPSHSMIVTATGSSVGDIKITQHTTNRLNYSLATDMQNFPHAAWWLVQPY